ncbi:MAG: tetratricopeptide repeat protein [Cyanobacteria bacterium P01_F01_bin.53]
MAESPIEEAEKEDFEDGRDQLVKLSLLQRVESGTYQLHQLVREYFLAKLAQREDAETLQQAYGEVMVAKGSQIPQALTRERWVALTPVMPHIAEAATQWQGQLSDEDLYRPFIAMARFYDGQGAYAQAKPWYKKGLTATQSRFGENHPDVATSLNNLALLYRSQGRYEEAEPLFLQALEMSRELLGQSHPSVATSLNNLATLYKSQGRYEEAEPLFLQALELSRELLGQSHPSVATSLNNLAALYRSQGRYEEAELMYLQALDLRRELLGQSHPSVATSLNNLGLLYRSQGRYEDAEPIYLKTISIFRDRLGDEHPYTRTANNNFYLLVKAALTAGKQAKLSSQPLTQKMLESVKAEQNNTEQNSTGQ